MSTITSPISLAQSWADLKASTAGLRIRDAAAKLGCSEAELLHAALVHPGVDLGYSGVRLRDDPKAIFGAIPSLGRVMALTRNDAVVSETYGEYGEISGRGNAAIVHTEGIDLRVDFSHWRFAFAVTMAPHGRELRGLHFFDAAGTAVHKVYLTEDSVGEAYDRLVRDFAHSNPQEPLELGAVRATPDNRGTHEVDVRALREAWGSLTNVHQFTALLGRLGVTRLGALRAVGQEFAQPALDDAHRRVLQGARDNGVPIMVFVRSRGCTQIASGAVSRLAANGEYYNVFDERVHLHIREPLLDQAWVVRKPTAHGAVTSVEIYSADGELALQFFGVRDDEGTEDHRWRAIAEGCVARG
ncbi:MAG: hemin-degrading factor [Spirochaetota bacterium]